MSLGEKRRFQICLKNGSPIFSLCWDGDDLVDLVGGGRRFSLDDSITRPNVFWAYPFDRAIYSRSGNYQVIYQTLGTKGLIIQGNKLIREINRSFYHADVYEYPITFVCLPEGGVGIAHCPEEYCRLEIEEVESGKPLTWRSGKSPDFFPSRLQTSLDGRYLLSAGWVWHPIDHACLFSIEKAFRDPAHLDNPIDFELPEELFGVNSATFQGNEALLLAGSSESDDSKAFIARYNLQEATIETKSALETVPGNIMPVGSDHFVGFYEHPKLFEISSGKIIQNWPELKSGTQYSSIIHHLQPQPAVALDPVHQRFAVANEAGITVIELG